MFHVHMDIKKQKQKTVTNTLWQRQGFGMAKATEVLERN